MKSLENGHPLLGHATTFGGHPLSCSTAIATLKTLLKEKFVGKNYIDSYEIRFAEEKIF